MAGDLPHNLHVSQRDLKHRRRDGAHEARAAARCWDRGGAHDPSIPVVPLGQGNDAHKEKAARPRPSFGRSAQLTRLILTIKEANLTTCGMAGDIAGWSAKRWQQQASQNISGVARNQLTQSSAFAG